MRIGVDVGGTNTDSVLMDGDRVVASKKQPTSENISDGIVGSIQSILGQSQTSPSQIDCVMIGTTQFTNAFVQRNGMQQVGVIRISLPAGSAVPPLVDWPGDAAEAVGRHCTQVAGGIRYDGREDSPLDERSVATAAKENHRAGVRSFAVSSMFSPLNSAMERRAAEIIKNEAPDSSVSLSAEIGSLGLLARENATVMNASLADLSTRVVRSFEEALERLDIQCPFFISQNDGTLMTAAAVEKYPVLTFASGPTNSMRGAAYLSGLRDAIVADIGGTTTDIGVLINGFPRESAMTADVGGVRTNFRMPDVLALGLGGGSRVRMSDAVSVGPDSVGFRLMKEGIVFGGDTLTATDIAVAAGYANIGNAVHVEHLDSEVVANAVTDIHAQITDGVDRIRTSATKLPLILVGGGSVLVRDDIRGVSDVITPDHAPVANAIGASIAQIGAKIDRVCSYDEIGRDVALTNAKEEARQNAIAAGAARDSVEILDVEEIPLAYVPGGSVRVRVKAAGRLHLATQHVGSA